MPTLSTFAASSARTQTLSAEVRIPERTNLLAREDQGVAASPDALIEVRLQRYVGLGVVPGWQVTPMGSARTRHSSRAPLRYRLSHGSG